MASSLKSLLGSVAGVYQARAAKDRERKAFLAPRPKTKSQSRDPKGIEERNPIHRMYMKPEQYLGQHGMKGVNVHE